MENKIYVYLSCKNEAILKFPEYNMETTAYIGKNGLTNEKKEGDGKTPIGEFELGKILGMHSKQENVNGLEYIRINKDMYWVDDSKSKYYNKLVNVNGVVKDWSSAEHLIDYPIQYEFLIEIKTNPNNIPGNGSAIFLHCIKDVSTAGCVAVDREVMRRIVQNIDKNTKIEICNTRVKKTIKNT